MIVHHIKYIPESFADMTIAELSEDDLQAVPKNIEECWYMKMEGVALNGHSVRLYQLLMRRGKYYFRHAQGGFTLNRPHLSSIQNKGKGRSLPELWRSLPDRLKEDLKHLFSAASEISSSRKLLFSAQV